MYQIAISREAHNPKVNDSIKRWNYWKRNCCAQVRRSRSKRDCQVCECATPSAWPEEVFQREADDASDPEDPPAILPMVTGVPSNRVNWNPGKSSL